ncbi:MAG: trimethylamine methyltransferase family protein [Anaerolineae bacterium]|nr:trimethylamine methyltransferase family protein [Anaerolineae bacterium]
MRGYERGAFAPTFRVLSEEQIERLYAATLECVSRTGLYVHNAEARDLLARAGAQVEGIRVRIPPHVIRDAVAATPRSFTLWARPSEDGAVRAAGLDLQVAPDRTYFGAGPTCTYFMDPTTGERRKARRGDPALAALVSDALDNIDYVMGLALIDDVPHHLAPVYEFAEMVINTTKPVLPWAYSVDNVRDIYQIGLAVAGSEQALRARPFFGLFVTFQSPLIQTDEDLANAFWAAERGIPVIIIGGGAAGTSAPVTGAGTLVISLAGALTTLAIIQLKQPGAPVCIGGVPEAMDLRTARPAYGGPEMSLYSAAMAEVARDLGLPFMGTAGASESKVLDLQAAIESTFQVVVSGLSAAALIHDVGFLDCADIGSLESLVMNDEIISMTRRLMRGIEINDDTLMLDLIDRIGPGGEFVSTKETARRCRREIWNPRLFDRQAWVGWEAEGSKDTLARIRERLQAILASHRPPALLPGTLERIEEILERASAR